jgi:hypothetical protein
MTQQGKYLVWALVLIALAGLVLVIEHYWVTDNERIEAVVRDIGSAALHGDVDRVLSHLTPNVILSQNELAVRGKIAHAVIRTNLDRTEFDFLTISDVEADAGQQTRRGTATFRVFTGGRFGNFNFLTDARGTDWSFGFEETEDGVWKVNRITATRLFRNFQIPMHVLQPAGMEGQ